MKWIVVVLFGFLQFSQANAVESYNIPPYIRFALDREGSSSPLVYYFSPPDTAQDYPILLLCEGSSSKGALSV